MEVDLEQSETEKQLTVLFSKFEGLQKIMEDLISSHNELLNENKELREKVEILTAKLDALLKVHEIPKKVLFFFLFF
jgi:regulator of replication initiation timing